MTNTKNGCDYLSSSALSYYGTSQKIYEASISTTNKRGDIDELWAGHLSSSRTYSLLLHTPNKELQPNEHHENSHIYNVLSIVWGPGIRNRSLYFNPKICLNAKVNVSLQWQAQLIIFFFDVLCASNKNQVSKVEMISN